MSLPTTSPHETDTDSTITVAEARALLRISRAKMAELLKSTLSSTPDILDGRIKRVKLADVQKLLADDKRRRPSSSESLPTTQ